MTIYGIKPSIDGVSLKDHKSFLNSLNSLHFCSYWYQISFQNKISAWTKDEIEHHIDSMEKGLLNGLYGKDVMNSIRYLSQKYIKLEGKHILIIGSILPWIESLLISMNVGHITVLEYDPYPSTHPKITSISPLHFSELVISNQAPMFDGMISFSSLEHSGLGR